MKLLSLNFFFFFKQMTAYEFLRSDWSSDVCSSDLSRRKTATDSAAAVRPTADPLQRPPPARSVKIGRASCREECVSTCRSRWSPDHYKKKNHIKISNNRARPQEHNVMEMHISK